MDDGNSVADPLNQSGARDVSVFFCYRRRDGEWFAEWLYERLHGHRYVDRAGRPCRIQVYFDKTAPGVADWKALHFPSLRSARALVVISTAGIAKDFTRRGEPDWVYEELRWWVSARQAPPIVIDTTGEGTRWFPELIVTKWPNLNWIGLDRDEALGDPGSVGERVRDRIVGAIEELEHKTLFQELERSRRQERRLGVALGTALALLVATALLGIYANSQRIEADNQRRVAVSRALSIQSGSQLTSDPELALLLAMEARRVSPTPEGENALRRSLAESHLRLTLRGHEAGLSDAVFSPDGTSILTGGWDKSARVWDATTGALRFDLRGHRGEVREPRFSPDGRLIVTASSDNTARIWEADSGKLLTEFRGHTDQLKSASFSSDCTRIVTASLDATARIWDVKGSRQLAELRGHKEDIQVATFSPGGQIVLTVSIDGTARLWDGHSGELRHVLRGHKEDLNTGGLKDGAFSPDGALVVTGSQDNTARIWSVATGKQLRVLAHPELVESVAFSPDGSHIATASWDGTARMWTTSAGQLVREFRGDTKIVRKVAFSPNGRWLLTTSSTRMQIWNANSGELVATMRGHNGSINGASFSHDGKRIVTASSDGTARVWDAGNWEPEFELKAPGLSRARFSPDGRFVISANSDDKAHIWRASDGAFHAALAHGGVIDAVFSHDNQLIATSSVNKTMRLWGVSSRNLIRTLPTPAGPLFSTTFSPNDRLVAAVTADKAVTVWDVNSGNVRYRIQAGNLTSVAFSSDGQYVVTCGVIPDNPRVWNAESGREVANLKGQRIFGAYAPVSPNGKYVLTSGDRTARLWDIATGSVVRDFEGHTDQLVTAFFSMDGERIVTTSFDNTARIWQTATGEMTAELRGHAGALSNGIFSPDGRWVATSGSDGTVRIWDSRSGAALLVLRGQSGAITSLEYNHAGSQLLVTAADEDDAAFLYRCSECVSVHELDKLALSRVTRQLTAVERPAFGLPAIKTAVAESAPGMAPGTNAKIRRAEKVELRNLKWIEESIGLDEEHIYTVHGTQGRGIGVITRTPPDSNFDAYITVLDPNGKVLAEDDDGAPTDPKFRPWDAMVALNVPQSGRYTIVVKGINGNVGRYSIAGGSEP